MFHFSRSTDPKEKLCLQHFAVPLGSGTPLWMEDPEVPRRCFVKVFFVVLPLGSGTPSSAGDALGP